MICIRNRCGNLFGAFSLVELLIVLSVAGMFLAVSAPLFLLRSSRESVAMEELVAVLERARSDASVLSSDVYVVFPAENAPREYAFRSCAIYGFAEEMEQSGELVQRSPWFRLPPGLVFARGSDLASGEVPVSAGTDAQQTVFDVGDRVKISTRDAGGVVTMEAHYVRYGYRGMMSAGGDGTNRVVHLVIAREEPGGFWRSRQRHDHRGVAISRDTGRVMPW